jgi:hypothetical protein
MKNVLEFRAQASLCRQLAICDSKSSDYWMAEAERWSRLAQDEISTHYEECNVIQLREQFPARMLRLEYVALDRPNRRAHKSSAMPRCRS